MSSRAFASFAALTVLASLLALPPAAAAPSLSGASPITPTSGTTNGGQPITLTGSNFLPGAVVQFSDGSGSYTATNLDVTSTTIKALTPPHAAGTVAVVVKNPDGSQATSPSGYTFVAAPAPALSNVSPVAGNANGNDVVVLTGSGFSTAIAPRVVFGGTVAGGTINGGVPATVLQPVSATKIAVLAPGKPTGPNTVSVAVQNPDGSAPAALANGYTYLAQSPPTLSSVAPLTGSDSGGTLLTLTGSGFAAGASVEFRQLDANDAVVTRAPAASVVFVSATQLNVVTPPVSDASPALPTTAGAIDIVVINPDGGKSPDNSVSFSFSNDGNPTVTGVAAPKGPATGGATVTISGTGFANGPKLAVTFGGAQATNVKWVSGGQITATAPPCTGASCATSSVPVVVRVFNPAFTAANPNAKASSASVTLNANSQPTNQYTYTPLVRIDTIQATGGSATPTLPVGTDGLPTAFGPTVELRGAGLPTACRVLLLTSPALPPAEASSVVCQADKVTFRAPPGLPGLRDVAVVGTSLSDGRAAVLQGGLSYVLAPVPAISSFTISSGATAPSNGATATGPVTVSISGSGFIPVTDANGRLVGPTVSFGSVAGTLVSATSSTLVVNVPPVPATSIPATADLAVELRVLNLDGQVAAVPATATTHFAYSKDAAPTVTSTCTAPPTVGANCLSGPTTGGTLVTVSGTNFVAGAKVFFGTIPVTAALPCTSPTPTVSCIAGPTSLKVLSPPTTSGAGGTVGIKVANPDLQEFQFPGTGPSMSFVYAPTQAPQVSAVAPASLPGNGGLITINNNRQPFVWGPAFAVQVDNTVIPACTIPAQTRCIVPDACSASVTNYCIDVAAGGNAVKVTAPGHGSGSVSVRVTNADTQTDTRANAISYSLASPPALADITPATGAPGTVAALTGLAFSQAPALPPTVAFGSTFAVSCTGPDAPVPDCRAPVTCSGAALATPGCRAPIPAANPSDPPTTYTLLYVKVPALPPGAQTVTLANPDGQFGALLSAFRSLALPATVTLAPTGDTINGGATVTFTGTGFDANAPPLVLFGKPGGTLSLGTGSKVASGTSASVIAPAGAALGQSSVYLVDGEGQAVTLQQAFNYAPALPPSFSSITPPLVSVNGGSQVTVTGSGLAPGARVCLRSPGTTAFTGGVIAVPCSATSAGFIATPITVTPPTSAGVTTLSFLAPSHSAGPLDVVITNPGGTAADSLLLQGRESRFAYTQVAGPVLSSISPATGDAAGGTAVTLTGVNFATTGSASVTFNGTAATDVVVVSGTSITAKTPPGKAGTATVTVSVSGLTASLPNGFTYTASPTTTTTTPGPTTTPPAPTTTTGTPTPTPGVLTTEQIISANKAIKVTVTRDGSDNVVTFVLPASPPATPAGVQVFRSNSPYVLVSTLAAGSASFTARSFRDVAAPLDSTYKVTLYYASGAGKATSAPSEVPGFDQLGGVQSAAVQQDFYTKLAYGIGIGVLALLVIILVVVLIRRRGRTAAPAYAGGDVGYVAPAQEGAPAPEAADEGAPADLPVHTINCPVCKATFEAMGEKPLRMKCPNCGREGILR
ncbi:MAG TPA: IPT/TIG domain-containing protein [Candidatus Thermoplasmatota archaeon]|nr:IPT/TIG domain-containing protein [Candidatus Thermoplasmatota archaeon]